STWSSPSSGAWVAAGSSIYNASARSLLMRGAVDEAAVPRRVCEAPLGHARRNRPPAVRANAGINGRRLSLGVVRERSAVPDFDAPGFGGLRRRLCEITVRDQQTVLAPVLL